jgi:hypothetical protein
MGRLICMVSDCAARVGCGGVRRMECGVLPAAAAVKVDWSRVLRQFTHLPYPYLTRTPARPLAERSAAPPPASPSAPLTHRPLLDPDHPHPLALYHVHPLLLHRVLPRQPRRPHRLQHPPPFHRRVRRVPVWPRCACAPVGRHALARDRRRGRGRGGGRCVGRGGSGRGVWVRNGGVCPGEFGVPGAVRDCAVGRGRGERYELGVFLVS